MISLLYLGINKSVHATCLMRIEILGNVHRTHSYTQRIVTYTLQCVILKPPNRSGLQFALANTDNIF